MTTVKKTLLSIFGAQVVLVIFFGAFKFEKITLFLYMGTWIGIGLAMFLYWRASIIQKAKVIGGIFIAQIVAFVILELADMNDLLLEEIGFLSIGVWTGILIGLMLRMIENLEHRLASLQAQIARKDSEGHD
ncbi:MAG: hypothetical protein JXR29_07775 [Methylothermaceae bacterium]|nr:hypothetical protein [Methylothermaceae bacterium]